MLVKGSRYCTDSLVELRTVIANQVRNRGYYFFRPDYIKYLADSTITPRHIALRLVYADDIPADALKRYVTGRVLVNVHRNEGGGTPDTIMTRRATIVQMQPSKFRHQIIPECVTFRQAKQIILCDRAIKNDKYF